MAGLISRRFIRPIIIRHVVRRLSRIFACSLFASPFSSLWRIAVRWRNRTFSPLIKD